MKIPLKMSELQVTYPLYMSNTLKQSAKMAENLINSNARSSALESSLSPILIQKDLPQHKMQSGPESTEAPQETVLAAPSPPPSVKEKWSFLKSTLESAINDWSELEKMAPQKTPEEEQLEKMRSLISNIKDRLKDF
jgi:hypothetical protein